MLFEEENGSAVPMIRRPLKTDILAPIAEERRETTNEGISSRNIKAAQKERIHAHSQIWFKVSTRPHGLIIPGFKRNLYENHGLACLNVIVSVETI